MNFCISNIAWNKNETNLVLKLLKDNIRLSEAIYKTTFK